jgi:hypothetical protein
MGEHASEICDELAVVVGVQIRCRVVDGDTAGCRTCVRHGRFGARQQVRRMGAMVRPHCHTDAGVYLNGHVSERKRCAQRVHQRTGLRTGGCQIRLG